MYNLQNRKYDRISPLPRDLHWLRVPERIKFRLGVLVFRCRNNTAPICQTICSEQPTTTSAVCLDHTS